MHLVSLYCNHEFNNLQSQICILIVSADCHNQLLKNYM